MTKPLDDVAAMIREARGFGHDETLALRRTVWPDGTISATDAGILFDLNHASPTASAEWVDFFVEAIAVYLVQQTEPRGYISQENATWLMQRIDHNGQVDTLAELELMVRVIERAENVPEDLKAYVLAQIKRSVLAGEGPTRHGDSLKPGSIGTAEARLLRRALFATGGHDQSHISRAEAELLFDIKDATLQGDNAPEWQTLFVHALRLHFMTDPRFFALDRGETARIEALMADTTSSVGRFLGRIARSSGRRPLSDPPSAASEAPKPGIADSRHDWFQQMIDSDGNLDPLERALLKALTQTG